MNSGNRAGAPAQSEQGRESQLISMAMDLAEKQMSEGTASSQVITHFLKLGSSRDSLEQEKLRNENLLLRAKVETMASSQRVEELYTRAIRAMRSYAGQEPEEGIEDPYA